MSEFEYTIKEIREGGEVWLACPKNGIWVASAHGMPDNPQNVFEGNCAFCGEKLERCAGDYRASTAQCNRGICTSCNRHEWVRNGVLFICCAHGS